MSLIFSEFISFVHPWFDAGLTALTSWIAWRIYALSGALVILCLSFIAARWQQKKVMDLLPGFRGPRPKRKAAIERQLAAITAFRQKTVRTLLVRASGVTFFGLIMPSIIVGLGLYFYPWFAPGGQALVSADGSADLAGLDIIRFMASQLAMGMAGTVTDVAMTSGAALHPAFQPSNMAMTFGIAAFRYFIGGFAAALGHLIYAALRAALATGDKEKELRQALAEATL